MNIKKIGEKDGVIKLLIKDIDVPFINAVRRTIMNNIPVMAVSNITIYENTSIFYDELLANRLGMLPIKTDVKTYKKGETTKLFLEEEGPKMVYSADIKSKDPKIEVVHKNVPLFRLTENQKIKVEIETEMGIGKTHSKWQPAIVSYSQVPIIEATGKGTLLKKIEEKCPKGIIEMRSNKASIDPYECSPELMAEIVGNATISFNEEQFIFYIENLGPLEAKEIFDQAIKALENKTKELREAIKKVK